MQSLQRAVSDDRIKGAASLGYRAIKTKGVFIQIIDMCKYQVLLWMHKRAPDAMREKLCASSHSQKRRGQEETFWWEMGQYTLEYSAYVQTGNSALEKHWQRPPRSLCVMRRRTHYEGSQIPDLFVPHGSGYPLGRTVDFHQLKPSNRYPG